MSVEKVLKTIKDEDVRFVDLRFTDTKGKEQHVTIPANVCDDEMLEDGKMFDGSSIAGWKGINESDMILMPDLTTAVLDPFFEEKTLNLRCDVVEPMTGQGYERCPLDGSPLRRSNLDLSDLRGLQDWYLRYELTAVEGVSEVAFPRIVTVGTRLPSEPGTVSYRVWAVL